MQVHTETVYKSPLLSCYRSNRGWSLHTHTHTHRHTHAHNNKKSPSLFWAVSHFFFRSDSFPTVSLVAAALCYTFLLFQFHVRFRLTLHFRNGNVCVCVCVCEAQLGLVWLYYISHRSAAACRAQTAGPNPAPRRVCVCV